MSDKQQANPDTQSINIQVDQHKTPYQQPVRTTWRDFDIFLNSGIICFSTGWLVNLLSYLPLTAPFVPVLPKLALGVGLLVVGLYWALTKKLQPAVASYAIAIILGIVIGM